MSSTIYYEKIDKNFKNSNKFTDAGLSQISLGIKKSSGVHTLELFIGLALFRIKFLKNFFYFLGIINQFLIKVYKNSLKLLQNVSD